MAPDDLNTPLGPRQSGRAAARWKPPVLPLVTGALAAIIVAALAWIAFVDDPLGGEPVARAAIENPQASAKSDAKPAATETAPRSAETAPSGERTVTIIDGKSGTRTEVAVQPGGDTNETPTGTSPGIDERLTEQSRHGAIPRIAADGSRPLAVYARADPAAAARKGPQIAIVVNGLGIGASTTGEALAKLPKAVTLAFTPYGSELSRWVTKARGAGHEVLLQIPMEPFDYPDNDPGPQTLLSNLTTAQNIDRLHWFLSRFQGYVGVTNFMGARFTSNEAAFAPVLADLAQRGLLYFDDGVSTRSLAHKVAAGAKAPFLKADLVIDAKANWSDIDTALEKLERLAMEQGFAVGTANALPVSIDRIARWAKGAEARGIRIVPLSAVAAKSKQS